MLQTGGKTLFLLGSWLKMVVRRVSASATWKISRGAMLVPHVKKNGTLYMTIGLKIMHLNCNLSYLNLIDIDMYESYILKK